METLDGTGDFAVENTISDQIGARALAAGDWDGDGNLDLAVADFGDNRTDVLGNQP